jgi:PAS domain S-box-containing protein
MLMATNPSLRRKSVSRETLADLRAAVEQSARRRAETEALLVAARAILEHHDFASAARAIFDACRGLIGATAGYVALLNPEGTQNDVVFLESGGSPCSVDPALPMPIRGLREVACRTGRAVFENDFAASRWMEFIPPGHSALDNVLFAPLVIQGRTYGLLGLANKPGGFTADDARMATAFGELAAVALRNSRTLEALQHERDFIGAVLATAGALVVVLDGHGRIVRFNRACEQVSGYTFADVYGRTVWDLLLPPEEVGPVRAVFDDLQGGRFPNRNESFWVAKDGSRRRIAWANTALADDCGAVQFVISTGIDVTDQRRAEDEIRRLNAVLEHRVAERTAQLNAANAELAEEIALRANLEREIVETSEAECRRIGRDIHDTLGQELTALSMLFGALAKRVTAELPREAGAVAEIAEQIKRTVTEARAMAKGLDPVGLHEGGLAASLEELGRSTRLLTGVACRLKCMPVRLAEEAVATHLYRITQEAVNNALKHARARHIDITLEDREGMIVLAIADDGVGIRADAGQAGGMGMHTMRYRADTIGASLRVEQGPCGGTVVTCILPPPAAATSA